MKLQLFLSSISKEQRDFLTLLESTAKVHGEKDLVKASKPVVWNSEFYHLKDSAIWKGLDKKIQDSILVSLGEKILQEAYFIENAGMAYAAKMNLSSKSKEEREFFCFVAEEEARHLRMIESLGNFSTSTEYIPSFALLIGEIIQEAQRPAHLLLIQILLEGWGLSYYKSLASSTQDEVVANVFKQILKDEIRHHSAGVILFNQVKQKSTMSAEDESEFVSFLERISFMVKIGPWNLCDEVFKNLSHPTALMLKDFLGQTNSVSVTAEKLQVLVQLMEKNLPASVWEIIVKKEILKPLNLEEMTAALSQSISGTFQLE